MVPRSSPGHILRWRLDVGVNGITILTGTYLESGIFHIVKLLRKGPK